MPGSHKNGMLPHNNQGGFHLDKEKYPIDKAVPKEAEAGDVLFISYLVVHGSGVSESNEPRTTLLVQMRDPEDLPTVETHLSRAQGMMLRGIDPARKRKAGGGTNSGMGGSMGGGGMGMNGSMWICFRVSHPNSPCCNIARWSKCTYGTACCGGLACCCGIACCDVNAGSIGRGIAASRFAVGKFDRGLQAIASCSAHFELLLMRQ